MALCCLGTKSIVKEFTFLLIHVLHPVTSRVTRVASDSFGRVHALCTRDSRSIFFSEHTRIDVSYIEPHEHKFRNLVAESRTASVV